MILIYYLVLNAVLGLIAFEYSWAITYNLRKGRKDLDELHPAQVRRDDLSQKWKFYPGAMVLFFPRLLLFIFSIIVGVFLS
jgi:hypothetical protein